MDNANQSKIQKIIKLDYSTNTDIWLTKQDSLRKLIGILGIMLPFLLVGFLCLATNLRYITPLESISHYFYTRIGSIFIIVVSLLAIFLLIYKGDEPKDFIISSVAGIFALCVLLFPTSNLTDKCCDCSKYYAVTFLSDTTKFRVTFHFISAGIFLTCLAYMSLFLFTKSKPGIKMTREKIWRNVIYKICGMFMISAMLIIFLGFIKVIPANIYDPIHLTFWMESLAVVSFGISWLVKGEAILKDGSLIKKNKGK